MMLHTQTQYRDPRKRCSLPTHIRHFVYSVFSLNFQSFYYQEIVAIYHSVFDLSPLTYMCVDIDFRLFSD